MPTESLVADNEMSESGYKARKSCITAMKDIQDWLECGIDDPGYHILTDDKIIKNVVNDQGSGDNEVKLRDDDQVEEGPSN
ncbi:hypothetical protein LAZ67_1001673 [Cordylochernes scorpioides]|uniref:Uncharacterized protein n=1 Tax=Cordylochernes scorpioides TaxID=51811 RepID=A0ABY6JVX3_9ARAC|nr:hypothetical protein LAZ67_1001673 [Cordylochernes scorpioides]